MKKKNCHGDSVKPVQVFLYLNLGVEYIEKQSLFSNANEAGIKNLNFIHVLNIVHNTATHCAYP